MNEEMLRNWTGEALKKTRDAATYLVKARYATDTIQQSYFAGGSTGGREALQVATRWPADWTGIIAWYPAWKQMSAMLAGHRVNRALAQPGAYPNTPKRKLVYDAAIEACDGLDGLLDGLIGNQNRCNAVFDPATASLTGTPLRCPDGVDTGDTCLSDVQIATLKAMNASTRFNFTLASGETGYPGYNVWGADLGITSNPSPLQPTITFLNLNTSPPAHPMPSTAPYISRQLDGMIRYGVTRDPGYDSLSLDPENPGPWGPRLSEISTLLDVAVDLDAFAAKGGKLLLAHGLSDVLVSSRGTEEYYQRLQARMGPAEVAKFARYYEAPGYGHALSTAFNVEWDSLTALENWVEQGTAPPPQVMGDTASGAVARTRPLCEYPHWARYNGSGDVNAAASFTCVPYEDAPPTQRATHLGTVIGSDLSATSGTYAWKGIPYAKAPVGDLRWRAPAEAEPWTTPRYTQTFGNACASAGRLYGPGTNNRYDATIGTTLGQTVGSEDCLYLNVWRPASAATNLPVIVWVHGGSNITGYTADPVYDGANLARSANAVVVSVNYRLGLLGFLNLGQLKSGTDALDDSGNFAILDIIKALQFVNRNVAGFGGNAGNVTLMGQSAGAVNVFAVMTSPLVVAANPAIVHKLLPISGGLSPASELPAGSIATMAAPSAFRGQADYFLAQLVIADGLAADLTSASAYVASKTPAEIAAYMRSKSADTIWQTVVTQLAPIGAGGSGPIGDGNVVPLNPIAAIRAGQYVKGPVLMGNTRDEGKLFPTLLPLVGGAVGRLINDATVFSIAYGYQPDAAPQTTLDAWIPRVLPAGDDADDGLERPHRAAQPHLLPEQPRQHDRGAADPAEQHLALPLRLGRAAGTVQRHLRCGACVRPAVRVRQFRAGAVFEHLVHHREPQRPARAVGRDDAQHRRLRAQRRSEPCRARRHLAGLAIVAAVRRDPHGQGHLGAELSPRKTGPCRSSNHCGRAPACASSSRRARAASARRSRAPSTTPDRRCTSATSIVRRSTASSARHRASAAAWPMRRSRPTSTSSSTTCAARSVGSTCWSTTPASPGRPARSRASTPPAGSARSMSTSTASTTSRGARSRCSRRRRRARC